MNTPRERVLLVENDPDISDLIARQTLQALGYRVEVAQTAASALQAAARFSPDVVITNLNLPGLSGKDLLVALSSQGLDIPVIVIAMKGMESDVIQAFRLGATDYLIWPAREAEVVSAVERVLKQVRAKRLPSSSNKPMTSCKAVYANLPRSSPSARQSPPSPTNAHYLKKSWKGPSM
jgi:DNA-binding response OmpR family regulator